MKEKCLSAETNQLHLS